MKYNPTDDLLYAIYSQTSTTTNDYLYSIDSLTVDVTFIGDTGLTDIQGAEFDGDDTFYSWSTGLIAIETSDPSVVISSGTISTSFSIVSLLAIVSTVVVRFAIVWLLLLHRVGY